MKHILSHFGQFLYRVPFFSYDAIHSRLKDLSCGQADEFLHEYLSKPAVREAIFLASPSFDKEVALYLEGGIAKSDNAARHDKFVTSAMKYIVRMASRPTPFGMFAGCGIGKVGDEDRIAPDPENPLLRRVRPDTGFLISVYEEILKNKEQNKWFRYFTNNTIYPAGGQYRYVEFFGNAGGVIRGSLINIEDTIVSVTGNTDLRFDPDGVNRNPAGLRFAGRFVPVADTYVEVSDAGL